jgi:glycine cleavage system aminomethyltransferase T
VRAPFEFLEPSGAAVARSPMEGQALAAGARMEVRDGWNVAVEYPGAPADAPVAWADVSHLRKREVTGPHELAFGTATRTDGAWWCPVTRARTLVLGSADVDALDVTTTLAALAIVGPLARELFGRFCALDLRSQSMPMGGFRPGSVARTPGYVLREDADRFLMLFGWALGEYVWTVVADAASALGGTPIGIDALDREAARA